MGRALPAQSSPLRALDRFRVVIGEIEYPPIPVAASGAAVFPLVGAVQVAGLTPREAEAAVQHAFAAISERRDIVVRALRRVLVEGEVARTDVLFVDDGTTLPDAVALAGGPTGIGDRRRVEIWREGRLRGAYDLRTPTGRAEVLASGDAVVVRRVAWYARSGVLLTSAITTAISYLVLSAP